MLKTKKNKQSEKKEATQTLCTSQLFCSRRMAAQVNPEMMATNVLKFPSR